MMLKRALLRGIAVLIPLLFLGFTKPLGKTDKIFWDQMNTLNWGYFKVKPSDNAEHAAQSNIGISTSCSYNLNGAVISIRGSFNRSNSWVKDDCKNAYILNHEQRHFDITEIYARKFRKELGETPMTFKNFNATFTALYAKIVAEHNSYQDLYDNESNHSIDEAKQIAWDNRIDAELEALSEYAEPTVKVDF